MRNTELMNWMLTAILALGVGSVVAGETPSEFNTYVETALTKPNDVSVELLWKGFLAEREHGAVLDAYQAVADIEAGGDLTTLCRRHYDDLDKALRIVPVSLHMNHLRMQCADLLGKKEAAQASEVLIAALVKHAVHGGRGRPFMPPIQIVYRSDATTLLGMLGYEWLYAMYRLDRPEAFRYLPLEVGVFDPNEGIERELVFDFLDVRMALRRAEEGVRFPNFRREFAETLVSDYAEMGDAAAEVAVPIIELFSGDSTMDLADLNDRFKAMINRGNDTARLVFAETCLQARKPDCMQAAVDALIPLVERRQGRAMVVLAAAYALGLGVEADPDAVQLLMRKAAARMGAAASKRMYALVLLSVGAESLDGSATTIEEIARAMVRNASTLAKDALIAAAREGDPISKAVSLSLSEPGIANEKPNWLRESAEAGIGVAMHALGKYELARGNRVEGFEWLERAAAQQTPSAQFELAQLLAESAMRLNSFDVRVQSLLEQAAHGGNGDATIALSKMAVGAGDGALAVQWLEGCPIFAGFACMMELAELLEFGAPNVEADEVRALAIYDALASLGATDAAWRATLLRLDSSDPTEAAKGVEAITRLAKEGNVKAQFELAMHLQQGDHQAEAAKWLEKCAEAESLDCRGRLGQAYAQGWGVEVDAPKARGLLTSVSARGDDFAQNELAWLLCTHADETVRNPRLGVGWAEKSVEASREWGRIDTLAACHAASGDFERAVTLQKEVLAMVKDQQPVNKGRVSDVKSRLRLYRKREAFVELTEKP